MLLRTPVHPFCSSAEFLNGCQCLPGLPRGNLAHVGRCRHVYAMRRTALIVPAVFLLTSPAFAQGPKRTPTAMHTIKTDEKKDEKTKPDVKKDDVKKDEPKKDDVKDEHGVRLPGNEPKKDEPKKGDVKDE